MEILLIWLLLCVSVCVLAARYDRSVFAWFVLSLLLSPLVGIVLLALGPAQARVAESVSPAPEPAAPTMAERLGGDDYTERARRVYR